MTVVLAVAVTPLWLLSAGCWALVALPHLVWAKATA